MCAEAQKKSKRKAEARRFIKRCSSLNLWKSGCDTRRNKLKTFKQLLRILEEQKNCVSRKIVDYTKI